MHSHQTGDYTEGQSYLASGLGTPGFMPQLFPLLTFILGAWQEGCKHKASSQSYSKQ